MGNLINKKKSIKITNLTNFKDIIDKKLYNYELCKLNKYFIRISNLSDYNFRNIISIACDFDFYLYIKEQLETVNCDNLVIHFIINSPCYLTFLFFLNKNKLSVKIKNPIMSSYKLIITLLENLPENINTLIIDYDVYNIYIKNKINLPISLEFMKVKYKLYNQDRNSTNNINSANNINRLPNNCVLLFF